MLTAAILNFVMPGIMSYLFGVLNSMQLVLHLPIFNVIVPANVNEIFSIVIPVFTYDVLSEFTRPILTKLWPQPDPNEFRATMSLDQMSDLGYDTYNPVLNLGTLMFLLGLFILKAAVIIFILFPLSTKYTRVKPFYQKQANNAFFGEFLVIFVEGFIEFMIAGILVFDAPETSPDKNGFTLAVGGICFLISNAVIPLLLSYHILTKKLKTFKSEAFIQRYGALYEHVNVSSKFKIAHPLMFILRRMLYIWVAILLLPWPTF